MVVARVSHLDPRCPVCSAGTPGIITTGAVVPPPFPNPEYKPKSERSQGGQHGHLWYHGCYDEETEVLTRDGWVSWPEVAGTEEFLTLNPITHVIEWQRATRLLRRPALPGEMLRFRNQGVDLLVTREHRMWAATGSKSVKDWPWAIHRAHELADVPHRMALTGGSWSAPEWQNLDRARLLGFIIGDGSCPPNRSRVQFHLHREDKKQWLREICSRAGMNLTEYSCGRINVPLDEDFARYGKLTYTDSGDRCIPSEVLDLGKNTLEAILEGLLRADGTQKPSGDFTLSTTSYELAGQVQELALKVGRAARIASHRPGRGHLGTKALWRITLVSPRNSHPMVGRTARLRAVEIVDEDYVGDVACVSVPNGTLYVRRGGKALWCGNTHFSPEEDDEDEEDPVVQDAGGRLKTPEWDSESGSRAEEHWNTDLGVHFTSLHHVAKDRFAKPQSGDIDSRVAHATLHMQNPKRFDSEHDMTHEAIDWAQNNGLHYLPQHHRAHEEFENGHYDGVADHDKSGIWHEVNPTSMPRMREQREAISHIDRHGPSWEKGDPGEGDKEKYLATHPQRATLTEGYRQHLQSQGHDGVVYGNEHEGPTGHTSAIAFPETPVAIHKWEWFHPEHGRPADAQESAERARMAPSNRQMKLFGAKGWPSDQTLFDETGPNARGMHTLSLIHSRHGEIGSLDFFPHENPVRVHLIHVDEAHRGKGYARAMADEVQRRYPDVPVDHGYKTEMGQGFWDAYSKGKPEDLVQKGRTAAASDWNFEHFHTEGQHWRSFGGPPESPRQHALEYKVRPEGTVEFPQSSMNDFYAKKSGPEAHARMRQNALEHHDTTEHDPASEKPAEPPKQRRVYYHGTTVPDVTHILPAAQHGKGVVFHSDTSPEHAYASTDLKDAWDYAQKAYDHKMNGRPRVYQVRPIGGHKNVEKDPEWDDVTGRHRGNNESDFRSKHGFEVVREMKPPKHVRGNYTDEEWGED